MSPPEVEIRPARPDDWPGVSNLLRLVFHASSDPADTDVVRSVFEPDRALVAVHDGAVVGHLAVLTRDLTVPGEIVPAAHVTMVAVAPTHRRRRLLTMMALRQLREAHAAGREPIAVLWASEGRIYPRFGYGLAAQKLDLSIAQREVSLPTPRAAAAQLRAVDPATSWPRFAEVYERLRADRPGWSSRSERWWRYLLADPESQRGGATGWRAAVCEAPEGPAGYVVWRVRGGWSATGPDGQVEVKELVATTPDAYLALWRLMLSIDLTRTTTFGYAAVDEPLLHLVDEPRRLDATLADSLWVRLVDLPRALAARRYPAPIDVVLAVTDLQLPANAGRWRLVGDRSGASCVPTDDPADLACDVRELGSAYLGGISLAALAASGRVRELVPDALPAATAAFGWPRLPSAIDVF